MTAAGERTAQFIQWIQQHPRGLSYALFGACLVAFSYVFVANAWVVDDAYITFRTVENLVNGYGLTWNVEERVQGYTHPLWMLLISASYWVTEEIFYTCLAVSFVLCTATFLAVFFNFRRRGLEYWRAPLLVLLVLSSKAFIDYSSSGLESPLVYLWVTLFFLRFIPWIDSREPATTRRELVFFLGIAACSFITRQDTILLFTPALLALLYVHIRQRSWGGVLRDFLLGTAPASLWLCFSLFYYGFLFPNTAFAKAANAGIPRIDRMARGLEYLQNSLSWDTATHLLIGAAAIIALLRGLKAAWLAVGGLALYVLYVVVVAGAATHMSGRFFAVPALLAALVLVQLIRKPSTAQVCAAGALVALVVSPLSPIKATTSYYWPPPHQPKSSIDTKWYVWKEGAAALSVNAEAPMPAHHWMRAGQRFREKPARVHVGGPRSGYPIGYFGFGAGPDKFIVDCLGLTDPLLARLKGKNVGNPEHWHSGHFVRLIPEGYVESVRSGKNKIRDPDLREYYGHLRNITRGPLFSVERLNDVIKMNTGAYDHLRDAYQARDTRPYLSVWQKLKGPH